VSPFFVCSRQVNQDAEEGSASVIDTPANRVMGTTHVNYGRFKNGGRHLASTHYSEH
jgi:hypothetical protein